MARNDITWQKYHIGLQRWNIESGILPTLKTVEKKEKENDMQVLVEGITNSFKKPIQDGEEASLPIFYEFNKEIYEIKLCSKGGKFSFTMNTNEDWIYFSQSKNNDALKMYSISGLVYEKQSVFIRINWNKIKEDSNGVITIKSGENKVTINVEVKKNDLPELESKTYIMTHNYAAIDVSRYNKLVEGKGKNNEGDEVGNKFIIIPDNGKYLTALRTNSSTITYEKASDLKNAPYAEYKVYVPEEGKYNLQCQFNPTSNLVYGQVRLRYGVSIDKGDIDIINTIDEDYLAGSWRQGKWTIDIEIIVEIVLKVI